MGVEFRYRMLDLARQRRAAVSESGQPCQQWMVTVT